MTTQRRKSAQGFTIVEALIGTGVFTMGILGSVGLVSWVAQATAANGRIVVAESFAQAQLEDILESGYDDAGSGTATEGQYDLTWTVTPNGGFKEVALSIEWDNAKGHHKTLALSGIVTEDLVYAKLPGFSLPGYEVTTP